MSARTIAASRQVPTPAVRGDLFDGVSTEVGDRRAISMLAMSAFDEPDLAPGAEQTEAGLVAFLPELCSPRLARP